MSSRNPKDLHPALQELWNALVPAAKAELGLNIALSTTYRSNDEQARLYAQGRTAPGLIVTQAQPGQSPHNVAPPEGSHAFDFMVLDQHGQPDWTDLLYRQVASIAKRMGGDCGAFWTGGFQDTPHVQMPGWIQGKVYGPKFRFLKPPPPVHPAPVPAAPAVRQVMLSQNGSTFVDVTGKRIDSPSVTVNATDPNKTWIVVK